MTIFEWLNWKLICYRLLLRRLKAKALHRTTGLVIVGPTRNDLSGVCRGWLVVWAPAWLPKRGRFSPLGRRVLLDRWRVIE